MRNASRQMLVVVISCMAAAASCAKISGPPASGSGGTGGGNDGGPMDLVRPPVDGTVFPDSLLMTCGNGKLDIGEGCDDGNTAGADGCSALCQKEADWDCPTAGQACINNNKCGDGKLSSAETCDDGNTMAGDGCAADCKTVDSGWQCRAPGKKCVPLCGDGKIIGAEKCDDGNAMSGDGCSATCLVEPGADCGSTAGQACTLAVCGDGKMGAGESCDAGPKNGLFYGDAKGCSKTCTQEPSCRDASGVNRACDTSCGNGNIETGEDCDDGNRANGDGCSDACKTEMGFTCMAEAKPDTEPCIAPDVGQCLRLPVTYRDFKSEKEAGGHPDFFYLGAPVTPAVSITGVQGQASPMSFAKRYCVPNSSGPARKNDSTARCWDIAQAALNNKGKPAFNATRTGGSLCDCQFTDWSHDTNGGHVPGYTAAANSPTTGLVYTAGMTGHPMYKGPAPIVKDATSFGQWFTDGTHAVTSVAAVQLAPSAVPGQYRFSSNPNSVTGGFFPLDPAGTTPPPGTVRLVPMTNEPLLCNLWPYWYSSAMFGAGASPACTGDQYVFPPSTDPAAAECANAAAGTIPCANGMWKPKAQGTFHDFWYTTEVRYLFVFNGPFELQFYGDDDLFIYINGKLALDLGGVHQRLPGRVQVGATGMASIIEGGEVDPTTGIINPCATPNPYTMAANNATCAGGTCDCRERMLNLGLEVGKTYEIAVFHADRHPTESNYQLTLSGFATNRSNCQPRCGDGVVTGAEECDDGANNNDTTYGGCTTMCKFGPFCGDTMKNGEEECDLGRMNITTYGTREGCTPACKFPHYCGDGNVDAPTEQCDQGETINGTDNSLCTKMCMIKFE